MFDSYKTSRELLCFIHYAFISEINNQNKITFQFNALTVIKLANIV